MSKTIKTLRSSFGSADDILAQLHAHQDKVRAKQQRTAQAQGLKYVARKPFESVAIFDLCAQDKVVAVKPEIIHSPSRAESGFSVARERKELPVERVYTGQLTGMRPTFA